MLDNLLEPLQTRFEPVLDAARARWAALPDDRRALIRLTLVSLLIVMPVVLYVVPLIGSRMTAQQKLEQARAQLEQARQLEELILRRGLNSTGDKKAGKRAARTRNQSLIAMLDGIAAKVGVSGRVKAMRPVKSGRGDDRERVELQLDALVLSEAVRLLYELEYHDPPVVVSRFEVMRDSGDERKLDVRIEVAR
ncbi:MAG: hypothetical protein D6761_13890 [Candidatus Dadabacteria bacterium]|nr:MAG: hypothetical protein D6761_13890 [Candidatus Dadabacteria bacterium]